MRRAVVLVLLLLTSLAAAPAASASGGTQDTAIPLGEGEHVGAAQGDPVWYKVAVPAGKAVRIGYTLLAGSSWAGVSVVDSEGDTKAYVSTGSTRVYEPGEANAWLYVTSYGGAIEYRITLSFVDVAAQDDAGTGLDAGQRRSAALPVEPGRIAGRVRVSVGDVADWYRVHVPAGAILDVHSATGAYVVVVDAEGRERAEVGQYDSYWSVRGFSMLGEGGPVYLGVEYGDMYSFHADVTLPSDLAVEHVEVREVETTTAAGPAGVSAAREVVVTVANLGDGPSRTASLTVRATHEGAVTAGRTLGTRALDLSPGESVTLVIPWDTTGQVGDVTLVASVANQYDTDLDDNVATLRAFVLASGLPHGLDLLNHEASAGGVTLRVEYGGDRIGLVSPAGFLGYQRGILTLA